LLHCGDGGSAQAVRVAGGVCFIFATGQVNDWWLGRCLALKKAVGAMLVNGDRSERKPFGLQTYSKRTHVHKNKHTFV